MKRNFLILLCLILFIVSIAAVSATEDVNQTDNLELSLNSNSEDKVDLDNNNGLDENDDLSEKFESDSNILAMSKADKLTGKEIVVEDFTFRDIQNAVDSAKDGDTVYLKAGTYLNNGNGPINIFQNNISIVGVKDSTILDAQKTSRIFNINAKNGITIKDIVFINGKASYGGAIYVNQAIDNVNIDATFINNTANYGGANYFISTVSNVNISGTYINNTAEDGGANYFNNAVSNMNISGTYINNTADGTGLIYFNDHNNVGLNATISDAIFINNKCLSVIYAKTNGVVAYNNWFGNNATNYNEKPKNHNVNMISWLFLNATADSSRIGVGNSSKIAFVLQSYNGTSDVGFYDASKMNVNLTLSQTLGELNKTSALIGEKITYTAKNVGNATVTGKFETVSYTLSLTNTKNPTNITVANSTVDLKVGDVVDLGATLTPADAGNLTYTSSNTSVAIVEKGKIKALTNGTAVITLSFPGNENYTAAENKTINVTVTLKDAIISVNNSTLNLFVDDNFTVVATTTPAGLEVTFVQDDSGVYIVDGNGNVTALKEGTGNILVKVGGDGVYAENTTEITVSVSKIPTEITLTNETLDLYVYDIIIDALANLTPAGAGNLTYSSTNETVVNVSPQGYISTASKGTANVTVSFAGNDKYAPAENRTITVTVSLKDASVSVKNSTLELKVEDRFDLNVTKVPRWLNAYYSSSNESVATVTDYGMVDAVGEGTAIITVEVGDDKLYAKNSTTVTVTVSKIPTEITLTNESLDLMYNDIAGNLANLTPADAGNLTFVSDNEGVVVVEDGYIIAVGAGKANVTVSFAGDDKYAAAENKTIMVTVTPWDASVNVTKTYYELFIGENATVVATTVPEGLKVNFTTDDDNVISVDGSGKITAISEGKALISVSVGDNIVYKYDVAYVNVTVSRIPTEIIVNNSTVNMVIGDKDVDPGIGLLPYDAGKPDYTSSDISVVVVNGDGTFTAVGDGIANVTVSFDGDDKYAAAESKNITVIVSLKDASVSVNNSTLDLTVGDTFTIVATTNPTGLPVIYVPDNSGVVSVDVKSGNVTALKGGTAVITVKVGDGKEYARNSTEVTVTVRKISTEIESSAVTTVYNVDKNLIVTLKDANGNPISGVNITVDLNGAKTYTTDKKGQVKVSTKGLAPETYTAKVKFTGNDVYGSSARNVKVTVKKATPKISAKAKTFKTTAKTKKYAIVLKNNVNKPISKATVYLKVGGKTYKATTNSKGKATFKITKLNKKGTYKATITYKGNKYYNKATKKVTIKVKSVWKTVSKGSKNSAIVKKIQRALKNNGYYITYQGYYLVVDGIYGDCTVRSVKEFQNDKIIKVTGKVDEKTAKKLGLI